MPAMIKIPAHKRAMPMRKPKVPPMEGFSDEPEEAMNGITLPKGMDPLKPGETKEYVVECKGGEDGKAMITKINGMPMDGSSDGSSDESEGDEDETPKDESFVGAAMPGQPEEES